jgi:hypothetical protein
MTLEEECRNDNMVVFCRMSPQAREYLTAHPVQVLKLCGQWSQGGLGPGTRKEGVIFRAIPKKLPFTPEQRKLMANELGQVWLYVAPEVRELILEASRLNAPVQWLSQDGWEYYSLGFPGTLHNFAFRIPLTWEPKE